MITNLYPPVVSGSSTFVEQLSRNLVKQGIRVIVITSKLHEESSDKDVINDVIVHRIPAFKLPKSRLWLNFSWFNVTLLPGNWKKIFSIAEQYKPDILNVHNHMFDMAFFAVNLRRKLKIPLVITIHTIFKHKVFWLNWVLKMIDSVVLKPFIIKYADFLICPDKNVYQYVSQVYPATRARIIPYGIRSFKGLDPELIDKLREKYNLYLKKVILSLGHLHEIRDRRELIDSMPLILEEHSDVLLLIVGMVSINQPLKTVKKLGLEKNVVFTGPLSHKESMGLLRISMLEVHWLNQEPPENTSLGIASLEAMSAGKPVITSANPDSYGEGLLKNRVNLFFSPRNDPKALAGIVNEIIGNNEMAERVGIAARKTIESEFSWNSVVQKTMNLYHECMKKPE